MEREECPGVMSGCAGQTRRFFENDAVALRRARRAVAAVPRPEPEIQNGRAGDPRGRSQFQKRQLPLIVLITLDIGRASSSPPPISLSTASTYSFFGSIGVLPVICTTL